MIRALLLAGIVFGAVDCGAAIPDCDSYDAEWWDPEPRVATMPVEEGVVAWRIHAEDPGPWLQEVYAEVEILNETDQDCLVAVYLAEELDELPEDLMPLRAGEPPPEVHPVLGERLLLENLSRTYSSTDGAWTTMVLSDGGPVDHTLTVLGCAAGGVEVSLMAMADYCDTTDAPEYSDEIDPGAFSIERL